MSERQVLSPSLDSLRLIVRGDSPRRAAISLREIREGALINSLFLSRVVLV